MHVHDGQIGHVINRGKIAPPCAGHGKVAPRPCLGVYVCFLYNRPPKGSWIIRHIPACIPGYPAGTRIGNGMVAPRQASGLPFHAPQSGAHQRIPTHKKRGNRADTASLRPSRSSMAHYRRTDCFGCYKDLFLIFRWSSPLLV